MQGPVYSSSLSSSLNSFIKFLPTFSWKELFRFFHHTGKKTSTKRNRYIFFLIKLIPFCSLYCLTIFWLYSILDQYPFAFYCLLLRVFLTIAILFFSGSFLCEIQKFLLGFWHLSKIFHFSGSTWIPSRLQVFAHSCLVMPQRRYYG